MKEETTSPPCVCGNQGYTNLIENRHFKECPCFNGVEIAPPLT